MTAAPRLTALEPRFALPGGRVTLRGGPFDVRPDALPVVRIGAVVAPLSFARHDTLTCRVPLAAGSGRLPVRVDGIAGETAFLDVAEIVVPGIHAVDSPALDAEGHVYVTCSGSRGQQTPVSIYRCTADGRREILASGIANATSLAFDPRGRLHVTSRFDGTVSRVDANGRVEVVATDLGVACGLVFTSDATMFVGDRSGTVFRVAAGEDPRPLAELPPSVAAFHLTLDAGERALFVTGPTLSSTDVVYRVGLDGGVEQFAGGFGRPQGVAVDRFGRLHVVEALAGHCGVHRVDSDGGRRPVVAAAGLVGLAFGRDGDLWLTSSDTLYRLSGFDA